MPEFGLRLILDDFSECLFKRFERHLQRDNLRLFVVDLLVVFYSFQVEK